MLEVFGSAVPFLAFATIAVFIVWFVILTACLAWEKYEGAFASCFFVGAYLFFFQWHWAEWWYNRPWEIVKYISCYFLIGTIYCIIKWIRFVQTTRSKNREMRKKFDSKEVTRFEYNDYTFRDSLEQAAQWEKFSKAYYYDDVFGMRRHITKPTVANNKGRITSWIIYWPPSLFWFILNDPIRQIGNAIYNMIGNLLAELTDWVWGKDD